MCLLILYSCVADCTEFIFIRFYDTSIWLYHHRLLDVRDYQFLYSAKGDNYRGSIHHYSRASIPMLLFLSFGAELRGRLKVQIVSDSGSILFQSLHIEAYPFLGHFQVVVVEVDVEQIDVPRHFDRIQDVGLHNFPSNGQGGCLGVIVYVFVFGLLQFFVFFR